jgi:hypothetical protein
MKRLLVLLVLLAGCRDLPELSAKCMQDDGKRCASKITMVTFRCEKDYCPCHDTGLVCSIPCLEAKRPEHIELCEAGRAKGMP